VLKPGGVLAITTECVVNEAADLDLPGLYLFSPATLLRLVESVPNLRLLGAPDFSVSPATLATSHSLAVAIESAKIYQTHYPHIVLEVEGRQFTSVALFFRKRR
jgi:hypothetical protein